MRFRVALPLLAAAFLPRLAQAQQNIVLPQTAGQNQVRWDDFDWEYVDLLKGEDMGAGIRLYYYRNEKMIAERATAAIIEEYKWLVGEFDYKPQQKFPYILYNSHGELEQTNLFQIGEGTLGVTSPEDLKLTTAYWGDHTRFRHVSLHEMVHQFTIQKVNGLAEKAKAYGTPLQKMPLWYIEGLAEFYSTPGGLDAESEQYLRDLVANPDPYRGYILPPFFSDEQRSFVYTYKLGQGRVYFLAETYGKDKLQEVLATSYRLRGWRRQIAADGGVSDTPSQTRARERVLEFEELLERVMGDPPEKIQAKWEDWLKRRYYKQYLAASQKFSDYREIEAARFYPDSFVISPDGHSMVYRGVEPVTGTTRLLLVDPRDPIGSAEVVEDGRPGVDSLHFFDRPVMAISDERIAYVARSGANDVLRLVDYKHSARDAEDGNRIRTRARFRISGTKRTYDPDHVRIKEMGSPVFSPDGTKVAFIGLDEPGDTDVWTLDLKSGEYKRVTNDAYAEKELDWGKPGIVFSSDATETRLFNLFLVDPDTSAVRRVTAAPGNHRYPRFTPDGETIGYAGDDEGKSDLYLLSVAAATGGGTPPAADEKPKKETSEVEKVPTAGLDASATGSPAAPQKALVKATDFPTGITYPSFTASRVYLLGLKGGRFRVFSIERASLQTEERAYKRADAAYAAWQIPSYPLEGANEYSIWRSDSWQLEQAFATLGGSSGIYGGGFLLFQDRMRDRTVYVTAQAYGRADLTDAQAVYLDRTSRVAWGGAAFVTPVPVFDPEYSTSGAPIYFFERKFGGAGIVEYPFNRYMRVGGSLGLAGTDRFIPWWLDNFGNDATGRAAWKQENAGVEPEIDASVHLGFDTLKQSWETGPLDGNSVVATLSSYYQPTRESWFGDVQVDAQHYIRLYKTVNLGLRAGWGQAFGDEWKRPFYVSSVDNLRGVPWYQFDYLISNKYAVGQAELQVPLDGLVRLLIFQNIEGIAAVDAGSLFDQYGDFSENRTAAFVTGFNFNLAIFQFRLHFAKPFDIGGLKPGRPRPEDGEVIIPDGWVTNFTIRYLFF